MQLTASDLHPDWSEGDVVVAAYVDGAIGCPFDPRLNAVATNDTLRVNATMRRPSPGEGCSLAASIYPIAFTVHASALPDRVSRVEVRSDGQSAGTVALSAK